MTQSSAWSAAETETETETETADYELANESGSVIVCISLCETIKREREREREREMGWCSLTLELLPELMHGSFCSFGTAVVETGVVNKCCQRDPRVISLINLSLHNKRITSKCM